MTTRELREQLNQAPGNFIPLPYSRSTAAIKIADDGKDKVYVTISAHTVLNETGREVELEVSCKDNKISESAFGTDKDVIDHIVGMVVKVALFYGIELSTD